jgi:hypothetical protein
MARLSPTLALQPLTHDGPVLVCGYRGAFASSFCPAYLRLPYIVFCFPPGFSFLGIAPSYFLPSASLFPLVLPPLRFSSFLAFRARFHNQYQSLAQLPPSASWIPRHVSISYIHVPTPRHLRIGRLCHSPRRRGPPRRIAFLPARQYRDPLHLLLPLFP